MTAFEHLMYTTADVYVLDPSVPASDYAWIDLSADRVGDEQLADPVNFERFLENYAVAMDATFLFGGYREKRNLYQKSPLFKDGQDEERNIHIGLDLWAGAGTPVFAALEGTVHSFNFNAGDGNYGPTIILEHHIGTQLFYTLYGHLSVESIANLKIGEAFSKGMRLGELGDSSVNGGYAPHLHFQVISDMEGHWGDYPGVCSEQQLERYLKNCPDPNLLLKLKKP